MKATDLMIGDHLLGPDSLPLQVVSIAADGIYFDSKQGEGVATFDQLSSIPLTPEILEKNGFRWTGSGDRTMMCGTPYDFEGIRYNLYVGLGKKYIEVHAAMTEKKAERWRKVNKTYLEVCGCYVHELQHALKLCGIDKEITL